MLGKKDQKSIRKEESKLIIDHSSIFYGKTYYLPIEMLGKKEQLFNLWGVTHMLRPKKENCLIGVT